MDRKLRIVVGPAPCIACRKLVVYARLAPGDPVHWRDPKTGAIHHCGRIG